jgi:HEAT repeat protein
MHCLRWGTLIALAALIGRPAGAQQVEYQVAQGLVGPPSIESPAQTPRTPWLLNDPADSLYRLGVDLLNRSKAEAAAATFKQIIDQYPKSKYVPEALYWHAFALRRRADRRIRSSQDEMLVRGALESLRKMRQKFPEKFQQSDAPTLEQTLLGELARRGDSNAVQVVTSQGRRIAQERGQQTDTNCEVSGAGAQSNDVKIAALNALTQMDAERALPTLQEVLRRRDKGSACLRRAAVLLLGQRRTDGAEVTILSAARSDPDFEVRKRAVLYLSQYNTDRSLGALDSIVREVKDPGLVEHAVFALSQSKNPRAQGVLRTYAERDGLPKETRRRVVVLLLQRHSAENRTFLRKFYGRLDDDDLELRRRIIQSLSLQGDSATGRWLLDVARNKSEPIELRVQALSGGARTAPIKGRTKLYAPTLDRQLRAQLVKIYSRHTQQAAALDELGEVAKRDPDNNLRRKALAAVSQSQSAHAAQVLREIIGER